MKLSIIIPCYNEINTISIIVEKLVLLNLDIEKEIIVVDDCSNDGTKDYLLSVEKKFNIHLLLNNQNCGKGYCLRKGIEIASGNLILFQDADLEYNPQEIPKFVKIFKEYNPDAVFGSRFIGSEPRRIIYFWNRVANSILTFLVNIFCNLNLTDMETGYKMFKTEILKKIQLQENKFGIEPEVTIKLAQLNSKIFEVGISYNGRTYKDGKKIGLIDAFMAVYCILKYAFFSKN